nr:MULTISPECIES: methyl-accepting chemotaxis protein [Myxococcaceae]
MGRFSLRSKIVGVTGFTGALVATILVIAFSLQMKDALHDELGKRANAVAVELANNLAFATFSGDKEGLQRAALATQRDVPDVAYVLVRDSKGEILARANGKGFDAADQVALKEADKLVTRDIRVSGVAVFEAASPVVFEQRSGDAANPFDGLGSNGLGSNAPGAGAKPEDRVQVGTVQVGLKLDTLNSTTSSITLSALALGMLVLLGCLAAAAVLARLLIIPLERLAHAAAGIAAGDLRQRIDTRGGDEIGELARSFFTMSQALSTLIADLRGAAADIEREAASVLTTSTQQSAMAHQQASAINETSSTVAEIAQTSKQATTYADNVISGTQKSEALSAEGQQVVGESVEGMNKLGEQVKNIALAITDLSERTLQIGDIIATVKDVAEQSNLLALNASIEAAKAGEHGRGFAVVATEMRTLAEQSKVAANQVRGLLGEVQKGTRTAVSATEEGSRRAQAATALAQSAGSAILGLSELIKDSSAAARQIAGNTRQQTIGVEQIAAAMTELSTAMSDSVEGTRRIEQVAGNLSALSKRFSELVASYQL